VGCRAWEGWREAYAEGPGGRGLRSRNIRASSPRQQEPAACAARPISKARGNMALLSRFIREGRARAHLRINIVGKYQRAAMSAVVSKQVIGRGQKAAGVAAQVYVVGLG
jgi:hypothetical protein